jgi:hypothetical protein
MYSKLTFFPWNSIYKEHAGYGKEAETQQKRIDKLIAEGADEADIRKQVTALSFILYKHYE